MTHTSAMQKAREVKMRNLLLGIETPAMRGDCLGVVLASCFEPHVESDEMDDSDTWKQGAIDAVNEVANAIIEQFAAALISETAAKDAEIASLRKKVEELEAERDEALFGVKHQTELKMHARKCCDDAERRATRAEAEAAALRRALEEIRDMPVMNAVEIYEIARAALRSAERQP